MKKPLKEVSRMSKGEDKPKRVVVIADLHCGHEYGLTPPDWWYRDDVQNERVSEIAHFQRALWDFYEKSINSLKPIDILLVNGDCIHGKEEKAGGAELITLDRHEQVRMAKEAIQLAEAKKVRLLYGTRYHVGKNEDFESILADLLGGDVAVHGHDFFNVNGTTIDIKHKIANSTVPHGRMTALARARLWNVIWNAEQERQPKANIFIRSHVHYYGCCGGNNWFAFTTPALCYNSTYGIRSCEGLVDVGIISFDFSPEGNYKWRIIKATFPSLKVLPESL